MTKHGYCKVNPDGSNDKGNASTQIKTVKSPKSLAKYIASYLTKKNIYQYKKHKSIVDTFPKNQYPHAFFSATHSLPESDHYFLRAIEGRLWSCSENLSKIECSIDENHNQFLKSEEQFFHSNELQRLSDILIKRDEEKYSKIPIAERNIRKIDSFSIRQKYIPMMSVYCHNNLKFGIRPDALEKIFADEKKERKISEKTKYREYSKYSLNPQSDEEI